MLLDIIRALDSRVAVTGKKESQSHLRFEFTEETAPAMV